jgi:hypothetical protein
MTVRWLVKTARGMEAGKRSKAASKDRELVPMSTARS